VAAFTISADPIFIAPEPALYHRVPPAPGFDANEVKVMDFAPDKLFVSSINTLESCMMPPVIPSYLAIALSVELTGPVTSPPTECRFSLPNIRCPVALSIQRVSSVPGFAASLVRVIDFRFDIFWEATDTDDSPKLVPVVLFQTTRLFTVVEFGTVNSFPLSMFKTVRDIFSVYNYWVKKIKVPKI
jgi:hypothetical protein